MLNVSPIARTFVVGFASLAIAGAVNAGTAPESFHESATLADPDGPGTLFGWSVDIDADTAVVGDRGVPASDGFGTGAVYVFVRTATVWSHQQTIRIPQAELPGVEQFGWSVAIDGDTLVAGTGDTQNQLPGGRAHVFVRSGGAWTQQATVMPPDPTDNSFGAYLDLSGDTLVVGGFGDDLPAGSGAGSAWVFVGSEGAWNLEAHLFADDGETQANFARDVAIDGDTIVVGAYRDDFGALNAGAAYVFTRDRGIWSFGQKLGAPTPLAWAQFGGCVDMDGDRLIVGRQQSPGSPPGSAYVFTRSEVGTWSFQQELVSSVSEPMDAFGSSVGIHGDRAIVGVHLADAGAPEGGRVSIFTFDGNTWTETGLLTPSVPAANSRFGFEVALDGEVGVVGRSHLDQATPAFITYLRNPADANGDGRVDGADLGLILGSWGPCDLRAGPESCPGDVNGSGTVDGSDLGVVLGAWTG